MLVAWLWTIPSILAVGVFLVIFGNALFDRRQADRTSDAAMRAVATERAFTAFGLLAMAVLSSIAGVLAIAKPRAVFAAHIVEISLVAVPWAHLLIGVNIFVGRKKVSGARTPHDDQ